jgi:hypothetical protein
MSVHVSSDTAIRGTPLSYRLIARTTCPVVGAVFPIIGVPLARISVEASREAENLAHTMNDKTRGIECTLGTAARVISCRIRGR